ncbi:MAG: nucleotidyltransferase domain-containing protein [Polyangiaceae bacterium]|nr:nucleotidyltransferase domain-containing protein [Polyangiaceae bacterium]
MTANEFLEQRRRSSRERLEELVAKLSESQRLTDQKACIYATGSYARGEASEHSDLDLFIVGRSTAPTDGSKPRRALSKLDEICVKAELIKATRDLGIDEFSGDGQYLEHFTVDDLTGTLGRPDDDATNTFTARLLLLLESVPLLGGDVHAEAVRAVVDAYWRDYEGHESHFVPAYLANDILRIWRTFCVNYEARTETDPPERKAKRKLKNYKLKHSRLLTCYSGLLFLLARFRVERTVSPDAAMLMVNLSPTRRLEQVATDLPDVRAMVDAILVRYRAFLAWTDATEESLVATFLDSAAGRQRLMESYAFGDNVLELLEYLGEGEARRFYRLLVV